MYTCDAHILVCLSTHQSLSLSCLPSDLLSGFLLCVLPSCFFAYFIRPLSDVLHLEIPRTCDYILTYQLMHFVINCLDTLLRFCSVWSVYLSSYHFFQLSILLELTCSELESHQHDNWPALDFTDYFWGSFLNTVEIKLQIKDNYYIFRNQNTKGIHEGLTGLKTLFILVCKSIV